MDNVFKALRAGAGVATVGLLLLTPLPASAQAPAPAAPAAPEPPPRLEASAQFAFLGNTGNSTSNSLGTGFEIVARPDPWEHTGKLTYSQSDEDNELNARSLTALYRASREINKRTSGYVQYDYLRDIFAGIEYRHIVEGGLSFKAVDTPRQRLRLDVALGYLYESALQADHFDSATLSFGAKYEADLSKTAKFTFQPRYVLTLADTSAYKYNQEAALTAALTSVLALKVSYTIRYDARPAPTFETTDTITAVSLVAKVRKPK